MLLSWHLWQYKQKTFIESWFVYLADIILFITSFCYGGGDWLTNLKTNFLVPLLEFLQFLPPIAGVVAGIMFIMGLMKYNKSEGREPTMKYLVICFFVAMIGLGFGAWMLMAQETGFGSSSSSEKITIN